MYLAQSDTGFNFTTSLERGFTTIVEFLPKLVGFLLILLIGYVVARIVKQVLIRVLQGVGLDRALHSGSTGQYVEKLSPGASPSKLIGTIGFWFIFIVALSIAVSSTGVPALTDFMAAIYSYLPKVIAALIIFVIAGTIATAVGALVARTMGDTPTGKIVGTVVPIIVMAIAAFMILDQLEIAPQIVTITYAALMGSLALGLALAFGLGGRDMAASLLSSAAQTGREQQGQVQADLEKGKERGQQQAQQAKAKAQQEADKRGVDGGGGQPGGSRSVGSTSPGRR